MYLVLNKQECVACKGRDASGMPFILVCNSCDGKKYTIEYITLESALDDILRSPLKSQNKKKNKEIPL